MESEKKKEEKMHEPSLHLALYRLRNCQGRYAQIILNRAISGENKFII